jgi:hypothetical protein
MAASAARARALLAAGAAAARLPAIATRPAHWAIPATAVARVFRPPFAVAGVPRRWLSSGDAERAAPAAAASGAASSAPNEGVPEKASSSDAEAGEYDFASVDEDEDFSEEGPQEGDNAADTSEQDDWDDSMLYPYEAFKRALYGVRQYTDPHRGFALNA